MVAAVAGSVAWIRGPGLPVVVVVEVGDLADELGAVEVDGVGGEDIVLRLAVCVCGEGVVCGG